MYNDQLLKQIADNVRQFVHSYDGEITDESVAERAESDLKTANALIKTAHEIRMEYTRPLDEQKKMYVNEEKQTIGELSKQIGRVKSILTGYYERRDQERAELIERAKDAATTRERTELESAAANMDGGYRRDIDFEVVDWDAIPRKFKFLNESLIKMALRNGEQINGIKQTWKITRTGR